eukprot:m.384079 g.384079  ORF g.384079 m.384079 type:complete len:90 (+) comp56264_c0_seq4:150-419(+)
MQRLLATGRFCGLGVRLASQRTGVPSMRRTAHALASRTAHVLASHRAPVPSIPRLSSASLQVTRSYARKSARSVRCFSCHASQLVPELR